MTEQTPGFMDMLKEASKKATEAKKRELTQGDSPVEEVEDFNILPLPDTQNIYADNICWVWRVSDEVEIVSVLWTKDSDGSQYGKGDYHILQRMTDDTDSEIEWAAPLAKSFAKAMLSASNWINIWKQHAGTLLEKGFMDE